MHRPSSIARRQTRSVRLLLPGIVTLASLGCSASEGSTQTGSTGGSGATATGGHGSPAGQGGDGTGGRAGAATGGASGASATGGAPATGGAAARGGMNGAAGEGGATGGAGGSAGTGGGAVISDAVRDAARRMSPGWNLGNSFDASPNETSFGNPTPTQALINGVHAAGFKTLRLPVTWTRHIGGAPSYTIDAGWMGKVKQTAQWAVDAGMYVFVNTHHEADGNSGWISFPSSQSAAQAVAAEVAAVWTQIAKAFQSFNGQLMFECFNEPNEAAGGYTPTVATDLNMYLEACFQAIRSTGGANATRIVMIQPVGASPIQMGIQSIQKVSFINDPNLIISLHTYYPTNFGLSTTPYAWGSASDYSDMQRSIAQQIRVWLPTQAIVIGEWGSMGAQPAASRVAHALAYAQDTTTAALIPIWWDNGGSGGGSFALFNRGTGGPSQSSIVSGIMTGVKNGLAAPDTWAAHP